MKKRTTRVNSLLVDSDTSASVIEIGDTYKASPLSMTIAVQKKFPIFSGDPYDFSEFPIFSQDLPVPIPNFIAQEHVHHNSTIDVQSIHIFGVASASQINIGNVNHLHAEARKKHIRIYY